MYTRFEPDAVKEINMSYFSVDEAYRIDSTIVMTAYSDGDLEFSDPPTNWGDRLVLLKKDSILFQSDPVGDHYQYQPFFYRNASNNHIIIVCQLGNEQPYGGQAFLFNDGQIEFIGDIPIESPCDTSGHHGLIDVLQISEVNGVMFFHFDCDSLIDISNDWNRVQNDNIHYVFQDGHFRRIGL